MLSVGMDISILVIIPMPRQISTALTDELVHNAKEIRTLNGVYTAVAARVGYGTACSVPFGTSD